MNKCRYCAAQMRAPCEDEGKAKWCGLNGGLGLHRMTEEFKRRRTDRPAYLDAGVKAMEKQAVLSKAEDSSGIPMPPLPKITPAPTSAASAQVSATLQERGTRYGKFVGVAAICQSLKDIMHATSGWHNLAADQKEALEMNVHKIARILNGDPNYADSWHDIAGYAQLVESRLNGKSI